MHSKCVSIVSRSVRTMCPICDGICHGACPFLTHTLTLLVRLEMRHEFQTDLDNKYMCWQLCAHDFTSSKLQDVSLSSGSRTNIAELAVLPAGGVALNPCTVLSVTVSYSQGSRREQSSNHPPHSPRSIHSANSQLNCLEGEFVGSNRAASHPRRS